ncbi:MAG: hypothetical protein K2J67_09735 [Lachnospiraceae bacterium]|nr:hypothetical protein [Lachnospiraceae bacterium]
MGKRVIRSIVLVFVALGMISSKSANAKTIKQPYLAEQAKGKAPNVKVYMTGSKMKRSVPVSGQIESVPLQQNGDIIPFDKSDEGMHYIILLDNSGSVDEVQFKESKKQLVSLCKSLKDQDIFTLYTVCLLYNSPSPRDRG